MHGRSICRKRRILLSPEDQASEDDKLLVEICIGQLFKSIMYVNSSIAGGLDFLGTP